MPQLTHQGFEYLGLCLEGFFFGLYSGIFALHLYHISNEGNNNTKKSLISHALCILYALSLVVVALDIAVFATGQLGDTTLAFRLDVAQISLFGFCDFIAQSILIHRCWIVWGRDNRIAIIPSFLAFAYLVMWLAVIGAYFIAQDEVDELDWGNTLDITSLTSSMVVNALLTSLIVFKIFKVFREIKATIPSDEKTLRSTGEPKLRSIIFVMIESAMALFAIQLARVSIAAISVWTEAESDAYTLIGCIHVMLNGITPTIILVRVSMGLSFHDGQSLVDTVGFLQFATDELDATSGAVSIMISEDAESLHIGPDDPNAFPKMANVNQEV